MNLENINLMTTNINQSIKKLQKNTSNRFLYGIQTFGHKTSSYFKRHHTLSYVLKRILISLVCLFIGVSIIFLLVRQTLDEESLLPDAAEKYGWGEEEKADYIKNTLQPIGLYGSLWDQLWHFWYNIIPFIPKTVPDAIEINPVTGEILSQTYKTVFVEFGPTVSKTIGQNQQVSDLIANGIPYSFAFGALAVLISYAIGIPIGIFASMKSKKVSGNAINNIALFIYSVPAVIIVLVLYMLPVAGFSTSKMFLSGSFWSKFWPELTMCVMFCPIIIIMTKRFFDEELTNEYVKFAFSKGVSNNKVFFKHVFRVTSVVIIRDLPRDLGLAIFGFSMITETQWAIPGIGSLMVSALTPDATDPFTIMAYVVLAGATITITSLLSDLIMIKLDPRIVLKGGKK